MGKGLTTVTVEVRHPEVTHVVKIKDFCNHPSLEHPSEAEYLSANDLQS